MIEKLRPSSPLRRLTKDTWLLSRLEDTLSPKRRQLFVLEELLNSWLVVPSRPKMPLKLRLANLLRDFPRLPES